MYGYHQFALLTAIVTTVVVVSGVSGDSRTTLATSQFNPYTLLVRNRRAPWDWTIDALKCTLKISSFQLAKFHDNQMMCCGLWLVKGYLKDAADETCEKPNETKQVYDEYLTEDLIYGGFLKSLLNDSSLDCSKYPEGSPKCDAFFRIILVVIIFILMFFMVVLISLAVFFCLFLKYRRRYTRLLKSKHSEEQLRFLTANRDDSTDSITSPPKKLTRLRNLFSFSKPVNKKKTNLMMPMEKRNSLSIMMMDTHEQIESRATTNTDDRCSTESTGTLNNNNTKH